MTTYPRGSVRALAHSVATGELTAVELSETWLGRLRDAHKRTNCVATWNTEAAMVRAAELDAILAKRGPVGPLHGVPITVKDWIDVGGLPCSAGYVESRDRIAPRDATVVARLRDAGAVIMAKTTVQVDSPLFGPVLHPHDPSRSPGASSSGESAAVAGGGSPVGIGSDSGGSIRLPAAWCGAFGLKPSAGRVPTTGHFPRVGERVDGRTVIGPIGTNVADLTEILAIISGPDGRDGGTAPVALGDPADVDLHSLRVGWTVGDETWTSSPELAAAVTNAVSDLASLGAVAVRVVDQHLDESWDITMRYWQRSLLDGAAAERQLTDWDRFRSRALAQWNDVDVIVMPATMTTAPPHRPMEASDYIFTLPASLTGAPAVVVPAGLEDGLPLSVQVMAAPWADHIALKVAAALESR